MQQQWTTSRSDCDVRWQVDFTQKRQWPAQWLDRPEKKLQSTSQSHTCTKKKVMVTVWWPAAHLIHYSFLNPGETITCEKYAQQIEGMHRKLKPTLANRMGPILHNNTWPHVSQPMLQKLNELGHEVLPHLPCSPDLSPTKCHFFKHLDSFLQGKCLQNQQEVENAFQEFVKFRSTDFLHYRKKQTYFLLAKMCWL